MSTSPATIDYILDQADSTKLSARKMFGEYMLYCNGKAVGLVCDDTLFIKITPQGKDFVGTHYREGPPYQGAKPAMVIDDELIEDRDWLSDLVSITEKHLPMPIKKPPRKPKKK